MRIFAISDLHTDFPVNEQWVLSISKFDYTSDILIVAGDISQKLALIDTCFQHLSRCFKKVLFVPGNHDLWVGNKSLTTSIQRYHQIKEVAQNNGIITDVYTEGNVSIVPLLAWYDYSLCELNDFLQDAWMDFYYCKWPDDMDEKSVTDYFINLNKAHLNVQNETVISFSHFMPRVDLLHDFTLLKLDYLFPVMGTSKLDEQIKALHADKHIYGHIHLTSDKVVDGVNYICNPLGYPKESRFTSDQFKLIHEI